MQRVSLKMAKRKRKSPYAVIQARLDDISQELHNHLSAHDKMAEQMDRLGKRVEDVEQLAHFPFTLTFWLTLAGVILASMGYIVPGAFLLLAAGFGGLGIVWLHRSNRAGRFASDIRALFVPIPPDRYEIGGIIGHAPQLLAGVVLILLLIVGR